MAGKATRTGASAAGITQTPRDLILGHTRLQLTAGSAMTIDGRPVAMFDRARLEALGAAVPQTAAVTEMLRWETLILDVGDGGSATGITYVGGDVTDGVKAANNNVTWVLADFFPSLSISGTTKRYTSEPLGPFRNGDVFEVPAGSFTGGNTTTSAWLNAVTQGGLQAGSLWWPLSVVEDDDTPGPNTWVLCWHNDGTITDANKFGRNLDTHIVKLNGFGLYDSHVALGATDGLFFAECARLASPYIYVLGGQFHPAFDGLGEAGYARPNTIAELQDQLDLSHRLARAPSNAFEVTSGWQYWNGSSWGARAAAAQMVDTNGDVIYGSAGFAQVRSGIWLLAAHHMVDTHLDVYRFDGTAPTGPWNPICRVPLPAGVGRAVENGIQLAWHTKIITHLSAPDEHSIAMLTAFAKVTGGFVGRHILRGKPIHVVIPWN